LILVDTSVWIDFFNHSRSVYAKKLKWLIEKGEEICLIDLTLTEILQGIRDEKTFGQIKDSLTKFPIINPISVDGYIQAANVYRLCRRKGKTISKTIDVIIATIAIENDLILFHKDKDFDLIAECTELRIFEVGNEKV